MPALRSRQSQSPLCPTVVGTKLQTHALLRYNVNSVRFFVLCFIGTSEQKEHQKPNTDEGTPSPLKQNGRSNAQSWGPETDEAALSKNTDEERQAVCSTTESQSTEMKNGTKAGRPKASQQNRKKKSDDTLKTETGKEPAPKETMEYQDDLSDADYSPS